ncbi:MAG: response regulator transcription factor [Alphaproteobacteria bacterium]|nr:response regulator transcription factor [Alphaproteobacteria bacterium]MBT4018769.1 response regulator transcription factor [Alphaproteobacteria bacterium]MBT4966358.1 response regulator transcription factor [Alphaproteobacteria bacterium]MBT5160192.1 response regulator transcription factor [Alphaproteobacteria bacterium]MBT6384351.1 response regulator transcription factor [Alphaproteobacteria bacterium]
MSDTQKSCRILIVDDEPMMRAVLKMVLEAIGCEVVAQAGDGKEAFVQFKETTPDLTLLDIEMPVKNGVDALSDIRNIDSSARVVMLTANDNTNVAEACIANGAADYIRKGQTPEELMALLQTKLSSMGLI